MKESPIPYFQKALGDLPDLEGPLARLSDNAPASQTYIARTYIGYLRMLRDFSRLTPDDVAVFDRARSLADSESLRAGVKLDRFMQTLGDDGLKSLSHIVRQARKPQSPLFKEALGDLSERMHSAQKLKMNQLSDETQNELVDHAIWSYRFGLQPEALVHFLMYHMFERTLRAGLRSSDDESIRNMSAPKDFLPLGDYIALRSAQGDQTGITRMWQTPRTAGGVGWISEPRQGMYNTAVHTQ